MRNNRMTNNLGAENVFCFCTSSCALQLQEESWSWSLEAQVAQRSPLTTMVPGSIPGPGIICELSFVGSFLCFEGFSPGFSGFPPSTKNQS